MFALGRFSLGMEFPRRKAVVNATVAAAVSLAITGSPYLGHAGSGNVPVVFSVTADGLRKKYAAASVSFNQALYGNGHAKLFGRANVGTYYSLTGHSFQHHNGVGHAVIDVHLYGVPANVLGVGSAPISLSATGVGTKKQFLSGQTSYSGAIAGAGLMKRGIAGVSLGFNADVSAAAKIKKNGTTYWRYEAKADTGLNVDVATEPGLVIQKALGGEISAFVADVTGHGFLKKHLSANAPVDIVLAGSSYERYYASTQVFTGVSLTGHVERRRNGAGTPSMQFSVEGSAIQTHQGSGNPAMDVSLSAISNMQHAGRGDAAVGLSVDGFGHRVRYGQSFVYLDTPCAGNGGMLRLGEGSAGIGFTVFGFAYGNIRVRAPDCRTAQLPPDDRTMKVPEDNRAMRLFC